MPRQKILRLSLVVILFECFFVFSTPAQSIWDKMRDSAVFTRQNALLRLMMNSNGFLGAKSFPRDSALLYYDERRRPPFDIMPQVGLEYPVGAKDEHLIAGGLWVGAIVNTFAGRKYAVSTTAAGSGSASALSGYYETEFLGHRFENDTFFQASIFDINRPTKKFFDDDGDGFIDEDELDGIDNDSDWVRVRDDLNGNGIPDHGDTHVDEDAGAISENDLIVVYRDSFPWPRIPNHIPLGLTVVQRCLSWKTLFKEPFIIFEYLIINTGTNNLDSVYLGFFAEIFLGPYFPINTLLMVPRPRFYQLGYFSSVRTAYSHTTVPGLGAVTPLGITLLGTNPELSVPIITYYSSNSLGRFIDERKYLIMSSGTIQREEITSTITYHPQQLISVGPFLNFKPKDTLRIAFALVSGEKLSAGYNNIQDNAKKAIELYRRGFQAMNLPPSPPLRLTIVENGVKLEWKWRPGDPKFNPEEAWDTENQYLISLPDTHWRRRNPPPGYDRGGRVFEGYTVWRSEYPEFQENTFAVVHQFDVADDLKFNNQTGIEYTFVDTPLVRGKKYWYAVTSFTIPDFFVNVEYDWWRRIIRYDTTHTAPYQSSIHENATMFQLPFYSSESLGKVKVVPNPYRTDKNYTFEEGGWEGLGRSWFEDKRQIWFIHLPPKCIIRIFTMLGEVVATINHDDELRKSRGLPTGQEECLLLSESNRAIASGVYIYLVESEYGVQTGKFVVIR